MAKDWFETAPQELEIVHFAKNPASVGVGDMLSTTPRFIRSCLAS